jgi:hypothetical protein
MALLVFLTTSSCFSPLIGMGFGGQLRYFGLWLASDFQSGQSAAEPLCSTYQSPRLSKQQNFKLDEMEGKDP